MAMWPATRPRTHAAPPEAITDSATIDPAYAIATIAVIEDALVLSIVDEPDA